MQHTKPFRYLILAALLLVTVVLLISCSGGDPIETDPGTDTPSASVTTGGTPSGSEPETDAETEALGPRIRLTENGEMLFTIVRPENATADELEAVNDLRDYLEDLLPEEAVVKVKDDVLRRGEEHDPDAYEILVGFTNYEETLAAVNDIPYGSCAVKVVGKKIVVVGWDGVATAKGVSKLRYLIRDEAKIGDPKNLEIPQSALGFTLSVNKLLDAVPKIEMGTFNSSYDCGTSVYELIVDDVADSAFDSYRDTLEKAGYTLYEENAKGKVRFATYYNDEHILNVYYQKNFKDLRVIVEAFDEKLLPPKESTYEKVCETEFAQVGLEYGGNQIGHCFIWKLEDGRFIVVDGGLDATIVYKALLRMAENPQKIVIASWILSHFHHDHTTAFEQFGAKYGHTVRLESLIWNSPSQAQYGYEGNSCDVARYQPVLTSVSKFRERPTVYKAHPGQIFHFANARIEILYTVEMFAPNNIVKGDLNTTSLVFDVSFGDFNMVITNDMTEKANSIISINYGSTLEAEVGQVAHHGYTGGTTDFYALVNPVYGLFTTGGEHYAACKNDGRNSYFTLKTTRVSDVYVARDDVFLFTVEKDKGFTSCVAFEDIDAFSRNEAIN